MVVSPLSHLRDGYQHPYKHNLRPPPRRVPTLFSFTLISTPLLPKLYFQGEMTKSKVLLMSVLTVSPAFACFTSVSLKPSSAVAQGCCFSHCRVGPNSSSSKQTGAVQQMRSDCVEEQGAHPKRLDASYGQNTQLCFHAAHFIDLTGALQSTFTLYDRDWQNMPVSCASITPNMSVCCGECDKWMIPIVFHRPSFGRQPLRDVVSPGGGACKMSLPFTAELL